MKKKLLLLLVVAWGFSGCEKDDICDANTITTPRLVLSFYDIANASVPKEVKNLTVIADGMSQGVSYQGSTLINGSKVAIPLKTDADLVRFRFILNYKSTVIPLENEDVLQINYSRKDVFVSRACGFKTEYTLDPIQPLEHTDGAAADLLWMKHIAVKTSTIVHENETHLEIFF
ncbi:DUF6452 family protein [Flavobacterium crassostreae]|uniref:Uncharacterized protein n=1 Tax=Flavobacterium crassostreae TaxID=1763534 RepID=A0A1B9E0L9_9FLAO|nr:DUF6452 family protein [Flavobacterium crassostreae]OCB75486.1 hypothetical protein LPBF_07725 [Flavobacterium crassostreae]